VHYPSVIGVRKAEISPRYLSVDDRVCIADLRRAGLGVRAIAAELGGSPSTVSRELRRNCEPRSGQYRRFAAQRLAARRGARPGRGKLNADPVLHQFVAGRLEKRWSPEQISQALRAEFPGDPVRHLVHETIYQAVYRPELGGLRRGLPALLRTAAAADRSEAGHWEGDLIAGASNRSAIGTLAGRASRFTILVHLPGPRHTAETVRDALVAALMPLPARLRRSLTWDQGKEMALHGQIAEVLGMPVFFCEPHSPWQRPTGENTNGLLRQYFPKGTDLRVHGPDQLAAVAAEPGARPRKTLGWHTPAATLATALRHSSHS
jgi:transposase, IS30 family